MTTTTTMTIMMTKIRFERKIGFNSGIAYGRAKGRQGNHEFFCSLHATCWLHTKKWINVMTTCILVWEMRGVDVCKLQLAKVSTHACRLASK